MKQSGVQGCRNLIDRNPDFACGCIRATFANEQGKNNAMQVMFVPVRP